jgi:fused signal recognition particle receptor
LRLLRKKDELPKRSLWQRIKEVALMDVGVAVRGVEVGSLERLEELLLEADFGVPVTMRLVEDVERLAKRGDVKTREQFHEALRSGVEEALRAGRSDPSLTMAPAAPTVVLIVGVNGAGKTTFIGKLSERFRRDGKRVLVAAGTRFAPGRSISCASGPNEPAPSSSAPVPAAIRPPSPSTPSTLLSLGAWTSSSSTPPAGCTRART